MAKPPKKRIVQKRRHPFTQLVLQCTYEPYVWDLFQEEYKKFKSGVRKNTLRKDFRFLKPHQWRALASADPKKINHWIENEYTTEANPKRKPYFRKARGSETVTELMKNRHFLQPPREDYVSSMPLIVVDWPAHQK